ncbi:hypothetical protein PSAB_07590 [Paenibacillus sabinae T27]|uniref:Uncharacterized protein n=1 Tax=Paenibacillus sabinae T27 TaxID=1268072 RepID=X4ZIB9_9BACL|nr:hypothetical protein PSAB_07590 [Paenibacillus sabinae T27]
MKKSWPGIPGTGSFYAARPGGPLGGGARAARADAAGARCIMLASYVLSAELIGELCALRWPLFCGSMRSVRLRRLNRFRAVQEQGGDDILVEAAI